MSANMPGLSSPFGFGSSTRTWIVRVASSTVGWTKTTFPENWRPGRAATVTVTGLPNSMWGNSYS